MKLSELKPGMKVLRKDWVPGRVVEVIGIGKTCAFLREGSTEYLYREGDDWIIVEPRKKPSERIAEINGALDYQPNLWSRESQAILKYLDEQFESDHAERPWFPK